MAAKKAKAVKLTSEQQEIQEMVQEYSDIMYSDIKDLNQTNIIKYSIKLLEKVPIV